MDVASFFLLLGGCGLLYLIVQLIRFVKADGDLTLLWAESFGKKPECQLPGKVVWVTGASSGIGEELAYQLASLGALLVLSARRENELQRVKKKCLENSNLQENDILILPLDVCDLESHEGATKRVLQHFGRINILVNNSGRSQRSLFMDTDLDVYKALMELNFFGTISLTKYVLHHMIEKNQGKIVTVNSMAGFIGPCLASGYSASKHALQGFFNSVRTELVDYPGISIINVCPGPVQSQIVHNAFTENITKKPEYTDQSHKMSTSRCARLILVSLVNDLNETWIAEQPYQTFCYMFQYAPSWAMWLANKVAKRRIQNFKSGMDADSSYLPKQKTKTS
ncbi:dehydrogenase/reductase SDR family member 7 [Microcaecilia unicolor]|uniref:Dehydrogenase/reductase SDR family member 7 n=1 Tax=Microcaecilia unicolor TaxID=1415580 RepID=A0A6P7Z5J1_9AMPH|nr:dehydrogenase/reductase SDR family member 7 [Microcaecilia unicolor]